MQSTICIAATYFEHLRNTIFATGESSGIQFLPAEGELPISSNSSLKEVRFLINHLNDPSLTKPSSIFRVLLTIAISKIELLCQEQSQKNQPIQSSITTLTKNFCKTPHTIVIKPLNSNPNSPNFSPKP